MRTDRRTDIAKLIVAFRDLANVPHSSRCVPKSRHELSWRVTVPYAACVQLYPPEGEHLRLETCRGD